MSHTTPKARKNALAAATTNPSSPVSAAEFAAWMGELGDLGASPRLAVAVSGGADSMALLLLTQAYAKERGGSITALTVDHGLRAESAQEARQVALWCAKHGIPHHTLLWQSPAPKRAIQEKAREARYGLMADFCREHHIRHLLAAHHRDDQAETLFFRLARGSGLDGLACMMPVKPLAGGVLLLRPLLPSPKDRLVETLREKGQPWVEDPSNHNTRYTRPHIRAQLAACADKDDISARAYAITRSFQKFRNLLENKLADELTNCIFIQPDGSYGIHSKAFLALAPEYGLRAITQLAKQVGGKEHAPRTEKLDRFYAQLLEDIKNRHTKKRTFAGCLFQFRPRHGTIFVTAENAAAS